MASARIAFRPAREDDIPYVLDSFTLDMGQCAFAADIPRAVMAAAMRVLLEHWQCTIACPEDDDSTIIGYIVHSSGPSVGWTHVRKEFRRLGVCKALAKRTSTSPGVVYCPFLPTRGDFLKRVRQEYTVRFRPYEPLALAALSSVVDG